MKMQALEVEMEALNEDGEPQQQKRRPQQPQQQPNLVTQLCKLLRMYMELYPRVAWAIHGLVAILCLCVLVKSMQRPPERNRLHHDYTKLDMHYNWKAAQMDHWCLFGGDDACSCDDFSDPVSREETEETSHWMEAHKANLEQIQVFLEQRGNPDVVFIGDDVVEGWNGFRNHRPTKDGKRVKKLFDKSFEASNGANADGLALGIAGDSSANLLWRLMHGEMPGVSKEFHPNVWWLSIGTNDLSRGGCSEEATVLGILRVAEEIAFHFPDSKVVIQGILPRSRRPDGTLEDRPKSFFGGGGGIFGDQSSGRINFSLWPSIQSINEEVADFCKGHPQIVYFDAASLFIGSAGNDHFRSSKPQVLTQLMPDGVHLSYEGYQVLGRVIRHEIDKILCGDFENDIEQKGGYDDYGDDYVGRARTK